MRTLRYEQVGRDSSLNVLRELNYRGAVGADKAYTGAAWIEEIGGAVYLVGRYTEAQYKRALRNVRNANSFSGGNK